MKKESSGSGGLAEGLSSKQSFNAKGGLAKPTETGRCAKRPIESAGRGQKIKGRN